MLARVEGTSLGEATVTLLGGTKETVTLLGRTKETVAVLARDGDLFVYTPAAPLNIDRPFFVCHAGHGRSLGTFASIKDARGFMEAANGSEIRPLLERVLAGDWKAHSQLLGLIGLRGLTCGAKDGSPLSAVRSKRDLVGARGGTCRVCGWQDEEPCRWSGENHGEHTLCSACAALEAMILAVVKRYGATQGGDENCAAGVVRKALPLNSVLNRLDELQEDDLDETWAKRALRDLVLEGLLDTRGHLEGLRFVVARGARATRALPRAKLPRARRATNTKRRVPA